MTMDIFVLAVLAPLTPAILWGVREIRKNSSAADDLSKLQTYLVQRIHLYSTGSTVFCGARRKKRCTKWLLNPLNRPFTHHYPRSQRRRMSEDSSGKNEI